MAMSPVLTAPAYTKGVGQSRRVCHEREEEKAHGELNGSGRDGEPWKVGASMGVINTGEFLSFTPT